MPAADASVMLTRAVQAHERGDLAAAQAGYRDVLQRIPEQADALHLLGVIADQQGRHEEAVALIGRALAVAPGAAMFHGNLGTALLALGRMEEAEAAYREALRLDSAYLDGHLNLANLLLRRNRAEEASGHYAVVVASQPHHLDARLGFATALLQLSRAGEALPHLSAAIRIDPASARARDQSGRALGLLQRHAEAVAQHRQAVALAPDDIVYRENLASALMRSGNPECLDEAVREFQITLTREPGRFESLNGIGSALVRKQEPLAAMPYFERAVAIDAGRIEPLINYSVPLAFAGRFDEALELCEKAMRLAPDDCLVLTHRGTVREFSGDYSGALADYAAARQAGGHRSEEAVAEAEFKHALLLLASGGLSEGWPLYRARMAASSAQFPTKVFDTILPRWDGVVRPGQRILVWGEQGVGDQVIYASMLPELQARGASLVALCDLRLMPLFERSFPGVPLQLLQIKNAERFRALADVQIGLGDLGSILRPRLSAFPPAVAYLKADAERVSVMRAEYAAHRKRLIVGLTWRSNARSGAYKSASLLDWAPVLRQEDILFVDLQYGDTTKERAEAKERLGVEILHDEQIDAMKDLDGFAAQAAAVDLVIGASNSGQHIAAALGCPCWIAVPGGAGRLWYWFLDREDSPWYPHVRLFRQKPGRYSDWAGPIAEIAKALTHRMQEQGQ